MKFNSALVAALAAAFFAASLHAQAAERPLPRLVKDHGRFALLVDDAPFLVLAAQVRNSSAWPSVFPRLWPTLGYMNVNTVETPVYWNQFEPQPGRYDYTLIDMLLSEARRHNVHLVPLWFATWKNGSQHYMPDWMKLAPDLYSHAIDSAGQAVDSPSPFATASLEADKGAFAALMRHLKEADPQRTVIMVQVENEPGNWNSVRDFSPAAQKSFEAPVPPEVLAAMRVKAAPQSPNWQEAFGPDADEYFNAWSVAKYVGQVAAAGKAEYPIPMYANAALRDPINPGAPGQPGAAGNYESGGPTDNVLDIWKAAAPALDFLAPDNYQTDPAAYLRILELYHRADNPLYLPETGRPFNARFFFSVLGHQAIGFSPSGGNTEGEFKPTEVSKAREDFLNPWAMNYRLIGPMQREIARLNFEGKLQAVAEEQGKVTQTLPFGSWNAVVSYGTTGRAPAVGNPTPMGRALVAQLNDNQFLVTGYYCRVDFRPAGTEQQRKTQHIVEGTGQTPSALIGGRWQHRQFLRVEEGAYESGEFKFLRIWNGDETDWGLRFGEDPVVLRVSLATY
ncbi:MAG: DUF5597 domain-containing protein [Opitutaceae bacterium]|jgi:hypothetical protein